jgi:hypothetical protein
MLCSLALAMQQNDKRSLLRSVPGLVAAAIKKRLSLAK